MANQQSKKLWCLMNTDETPTKIILLFIAVVVVWAFTWPASKIGLAYMPADWFAALRCVIGCVVLFALLGVLGKLHLPAKQDIPMILFMGIFQIGTFLLLITMGLEHASAGRGAVLTYSTPIWALPIAVIFFKESINPIKIVGLILGFAGLVLMFSPWNFDWGHGGKILGNSFFILAAIIWAIAILVARYAKWRSSPLTIAPWQLLVATIQLIIITLLVDPHPAIHWTHQLYITLGYNAVFGTAFAFWGSIVVSKELPVTVSSLGLLGVPVLGFIFSGILLGEPITIGIITAMACIIAGLACVALGSKRTGNL